MIRDAPRALVREALTDGRPRGQIQAAIDPAAGPGAERARVTGARHAAPGRASVPRMRLGFDAAGVLRALYRHGIPGIRAWQADRIAHALVDLVPPRRGGPDRPDRACPAARPRVRRAVARAVPPGPMPAWLAPCRNRARRRPALAVIAWAAIVGGPAFHALPGR